MAKDWTQLLRLVRARRSVSRSVPAGFLGPFEYEVGESEDVAISSLVFLSPLRRKAEGVTSQGGVGLPRADIIEILTPGGLEVVPLGQVRRVGGENRPARRTGERGDCLERGGEISQHLNQLGRSRSVPIPAAKEHTPSRVDRRAQVGECSLGTSPRVIGSDTDHAIASVGEANDVTQYESHSVTDSEVPCGRSCSIQIHRILINSYPPRPLGLGQRPEQQSTPTAAQIDEPGALRGLKRCEQTVSVRNREWGVPGELRVCEPS